MLMDETTGAKMTTTSNITTTDGRDAHSYNSSIQEPTSSSGTGTQELERASEALMRVELVLAYSSEKLLNLDAILMHVGAKKSDCEALPKESDDIWADYAEKGLQFVVISEILDSELTVLGSFMASIPKEIEDARRKIFSCQLWTESFVKMAEKLKDLVKSFEQLRSLLSDMSRQSKKYQRTIKSRNRVLLTGTNKEVYFADKRQFSSVNTAEQQRHFLRMLEKSLASELDTEKKLSDSRKKEKELKRELYSAKHKLFSTEEAVVVSSERLFEAENVAVILKGISKELLGRLKLGHFDLKTLGQQGQMRDKLMNSVERMKTKESALEKLEKSSSEVDISRIVSVSTLKDTPKEADVKYNHADSVAFSLREKINSLGKMVKESETQMNHAKASMEESLDQSNVLCADITEIEYEIHGVKENISKIESRTHSFETECDLLSETKLELNKEFGVLKSNGYNMEKVNLLEKKLAESDLRLQNAKASIEASKEKQNMLYSAIRDMETVIACLKSKAEKAENRAASAEIMCTMLSETNIELYEELTLARGRLEYLETSLRQGDEVKSATANDINIKTKLITNLVLQLATERERLQNQISSLMKTNKILAERLLEKKNDIPAVNVRNEKAEEFSPEDGTSTAACAKTCDDVVSELLAAEESSVSSTKIEPVVLEEGAVIDNVTTTHPWKVNSIYWSLAILIFFVSVLAMYLLQHENHPS